ncbi:unnamed protein product, partial [Iphiclides podalirius]
MLGISVGFDGLLVVAYLRASLVKMMVETILESSQDFGMSNGSLPQWKRELLQRRASRPRPGPPPAPPAPPPPPPPADDEELRYGPGIVKRLKSRYLSRRRRGPARPASLGAAHRALAAPARARAPRLRQARALRGRAQPPRRAGRGAARARPPRRPRAAAARRRAAAARRGARRAAQVRGGGAGAPRRARRPRVRRALRGLEGGPRCSTPEPRARSPSPAAADLSAIDEPEGGTISAPSAPCARPVSRAALEGIARAGSSVRYAFEAPRSGSHLPAVAAANPVLLGRARLWSAPRRVGVIRPMPPAPPPDCPAPSPPDDCAEKPAEDSRGDSPPPPPPPESEPPRPDKREPPSAVVEPMPRAPSPRERTPEPAEPKPEAPPKATLDGHPEPRARAAASRIGAAGIERAWTGAGPRRGAEPAAGAGTGAKGEPEPAKTVPWTRKPRPPAPAATSVVFNFSNRKEVPDYIENDGIILRTSRRNRIKGGEPGVVVLRPEAAARDSGSESDGEPERAPSPCAVRFVNDNVLINGRSSMCARPDRQRIAKLKLQFDDSLTRTFEYPSETSMCEESPAGDASAPASAPAPPAPATAPASASAPASAPASATLAANTHLVAPCGAAARCGCARGAPQGPSCERDAGARCRAPWGGTRRARRTPTPSSSASRGRTQKRRRRRRSGRAEAEAEADAEAAAEAGAEAGDARPCAADAARSWSDARALSSSTDLLF